MKSTSNQAQAVYQALVAKVGSHDPAALQAAIQKLTPAPAPRKAGPPIHTLEELILKALKTHNGRCVDSALVKMGSRHGRFSSDDVHATISKLVDKGLVHTRRNLAVKYPDVVLGPSKTILRAGLVKSQPQVKIKMSAEFQTRLVGPKPNSPGLYVTRSGVIRWRLLPVDWRKSDAEVQGFLWEKYGIVAKESIIHTYRRTMVPICATQ